MKHRTFGVAIFIIAFGFYLHGLYPSVSVGDSGEFITASHILGIPHEPGYPVFTLLSKTITTLIPFANPGYRQNLFSAFTMAAAATLLFEFLIYLGASLPAAILCAGVFAIAPACMASAQATEVFALNGLFIGASLVALTIGAIPLSGLLLGLGMGNHQTILFIAPAVAWWFFRNQEAIRSKAPAFVVFFLIGLSVYLTLLIRAQKQPFFDIGNPETLRGLLRVFRRADYGSLTLALGQTPDRTPWNSLLQLERFFKGLLDQVTWIGVAAMATGFVYAIKKNRFIAEIIFITFFFLGPFFFLLANLPFDAQSAGLLQRFYIAPLFCGCLAIAWTIDAFSQYLDFAGWALVFLLIPLAYQRSFAENFRDDFLALSYGRNTMHSIPPGALFIMDGGDDTFYTMAYLTKVEGRRSDIEFHDRGGVVYPGLYGADFRQLSHDDKETRRQQIEQAVVASGRPLYYSTMDSKLLHGLALNPAGVLYTTQPMRAGQPEWSTYDLRGIAPWQSSSLSDISDYRTRALVPYYAFQRAMMESQMTRWEDALSFLSSAHSVGPDVLWLTPNVFAALHLWAFNAFQAHQAALAKLLYDQLILWNPTDATAWTNRGAVCESLGEMSEAMKNYLTAIQVDPSSEQAHFNLAVCYWKQNRWPDVVHEFQEVLTINPNRVEARHYLAAAQSHLSPQGRP